MFGLFKRKPKKVEYTYWMNVFSCTTCYWTSSSEFDVCKACGHIGYLRRVGRKIWDKGHFFPSTEGLKERWEFKQ